MTFQPLAKAENIKPRGRGSLSLNSILWGPSTRISLTAEKSGLRGITIPVGGQTAVALAFISEWEMPAPALIRCARPG